MNPTKRRGEFLHIPEAFIKPSEQDEDNRLRGLNDARDGEFQSKVETLLSQSGIDNHGTWVKIFTKLAWDSSFFVKPVGFEGKDMCPSNCVKIKCIKDGNPNESLLIQGLVFTKQSAFTSTSASTEYNNPTLLLIRDNVQMADLLEIVKRHKPHVILVEKSVPDNVVQQLRELGVTVVQDMKIHQLERIARCIGPHISLSDETVGLDLIQCRSICFDVIGSEGGENTSKTIMSLTGCPAHLLCTVLLKGSRSEEAQIMKSAFGNAVVMAYRLQLETSFLFDQAMMLGISYEKVTLSNAESISVLLSSRNALKGTICQKSLFPDIQFYGDGDFVLGNFLKQNLFQQADACMACKERPEAHVYCCAHHNKQLTIEVKKLGDELCLPGDSEEKLWMWSRCQECGPEKTAKGVVVSTASRGLSFGNFMELSLSSHSSSNRLASCGHSFQKDFLYFFGSGVMVAMLWYSVPEYSISLPPIKLEFDDSMNIDWLQREINMVRAKGTLLFEDVAGAFGKLGEHVSEGVKEMLQLERSAFVEKIDCILDEDAPSLGHILLTLNRIRWEILLEALVWERRLATLESTIESKKNEPFPLDQDDWVWDSFPNIREDSIKHLYTGYLPKYGELTKNVLLHSWGFVHFISKVISEEGSRLHIPLKNADHIVSDFEGEISSFIACALTIIEYFTPHMLHIDDATIHRSARHLMKDFPDFASLGNNQLHREVSLGGGIHGSRNSVIIMYANEFRALREHCCPSENCYIASLSRCKPWDAQGGKSKSLFAKTLDDKLIVKEIQRIELESFLKFAPDYFKYMKASINSGNKTCLAKILGLYQVTIRQRKETKYTLLVMSNISCGRNLDRKYDLKGTLNPARKIKAVTAVTPDDVLLDGNFDDHMKSSPIYLDVTAKELLQQALLKDTSFLQRADVMDYSLLVGVDESKKEIVCGIIDYLREFTSDKQVESVLKSYFVMPKDVPPTIVPPKSYAARFRKFIDEEFITGQ